MTILRIKHSKNFTCIDNQAVRDPRLSFKARGLHHLLLSYPNDWRVSRDQLTTQSDKDGREAIGSALKELMTLGYIERRKGKDGSGRFVYESIVHELPICGFSGSGDKAQKTDTEGDVGENSSDGFSDSGKGLFDGNQSVLSSDGFSSGGDRVPLISNVLPSTDQQNTYLKKERDPDPEAHAQASTAILLENPIADPTLREQAHPIQTQAIPLPVQKVSDQDSTAAENSEERISSCNVEVMPEAIVPSWHGISKTEARLRGETIERPWDRNPELREAFIEYTARSRKGRHETFDQAKGIYICMVRNADYASPGIKAYDQVWDAWQLFLANAQKSETLAQIKGENEAIVSLNNMFAARRAARAAEWEAKNAV